VSSASARAPRVSRALLHYSLPVACAVLCALATPVRAPAQTPPPASEAPSSGTPALTDLDALMAEVLKRRDQSWRQLGNYVLDERERFEIVGPDRSVLYSLRREFTWYVRDGRLVRSPTKADGVQISEEERRRYEDRWLREEEERAERRRVRSAGRKEAAADQGDGPPAGDPDEPRFISEAHFFRFRFSPGNYYLAGRDVVEGRDTLRIEYYPTRFSGGDDRREERRTPRRRGRDDDQEIERQLAKVTLVTLWVDPEVPQIVKFTFDNVDFNFLPGRWLVRLDELRASMTMSQAFEGVWLPRAITVDGAATMATGPVQVRYVREFLDYRLAEVTTRWRVQ
jgi:hypothetical protein